MEAKEEGKKYDKGKYLVGFLAFLALTSGVYFLLEKKAQDMYAVLYAQNFLQNLLLVLLIPTLCLIPATVILGTMGKFRKDYSRLRAYTKWWIFSLFPTIAVYGLWLVVRIWFLKLAGV